jgi:hypothetical protein
MGTAELLKAWSSVLADKVDSVPPVLGAKEDVIGNVGVPSDEQSQNPYLLEHKQLKGWKLLAFIARFAWDLLTRRNIHA